MLKECIVIKIAKAQNLKCGELAVASLNEVFGDDDHTFSFNRETLDITLAGNSQTLTNRMINEFEMHCLGVLMANDLRRVK